MVEVLLEADANIEAEDLPWGTTPLIKAAERGHVEIVETLLKFKANIEAQDRGDRSSLYSATDKNEVQVVKSLLKAGANTEVPDRYLRQTSISRAALFGYPEIVDLLITEGANVEAQDLDGRSPMSYAAQGGSLARVRKRGHLEAVHLLLKAGANTEAQDMKGRTPIDWAKLSGHLEAVRLLESWKQRDGLIFELGR
jgi:ankyrin repeat protein